MLLLGIATGQELNCALLADKREEIDENDENVKIMPQLARITVQDFSTPDMDGAGCVGFSTWRSFRSSFQNCLKNNPSDSNNGAAVLVEVKQVLHPICSTVRHVDITDTSITNVGLQQLCKKIHILNSIGEYSVSDSFLRSLCVVSSMKIDKFPLVTLHTRKVSYTGMYNLVRCTPSPWSAPSHAGSLCLTSGTWPTCPTSSR